MTAQQLRYPFLPSEQPAWNDRGDTVEDYQTQGFTGAGKHEGRDYGIPTGTLYRGSGWGVVVDVQFGWGGGWGLHVVVDYGDVECVDGIVRRIFARTAHMQSINVVIGQMVTVDTILGTSNNTGNSFGPHLHLEARLGGIYGTPIDPALVFRNTIAPPVPPDPEPGAPAPLPPADQEEDDDMARPTYEFSDTAYKTQGETWVETPSGLGQAVSPSLLAKQRAPVEGHPAALQPPQKLDAGEMQALLSLYFGPGFAENWRKTKETDRV